MGRWKYRVEPFPNGTWRVGRKKAGWLAFARCWNWLEVGRNDRREIVSMAWTADGTYFTHGSPFSSPSAAEKWAERALWREAFALVRMKRTDQRHKRLMKQAYEIPPFRHIGGK